MAWIESHTVLGHHRKLIELARELRLRRSYLMGHLHALWHAALEQQENGDLSQWSDELIAELSDFPGDAPQYVRLLQEHGFLDGKLLHDWWEYAGRFLQGKYSKTPEKWKSIQALYHQPTNHLQQTYNKPTNHLQYLTQPNLTTPPTPSPGGLFVRFWSCYPAKVGKRVAERVWRRLKVDEELLLKMLLALEAQKQCSKWRRGVIPNPATWLNQGRWEDEVQDDRSTDKYHASELI